MLFRPARSAIMKKAVSFVVTVAAGSIVLLVLGERIPGSGSGAIDGLCGRPKRKGRPGCVRWLRRGRLAQAAHITARP